jgi:hypothetical protein
VIGWHLDKDPTPFTCAICERRVQDFYFMNGRERSIDPLCRYCERAYGGRQQPFGAFMDRRKAAHVNALAEALNSRAHVLEWERRHGR